MQNNEFTIHACQIYTLNIRNFNILFCYIMLFILQIYIFWLSKLFFKDFF
jgi:hypothetical protein